MFIGSMSSDSVFRRRACAGWALIALASASGVAAAAETQGWYVTGTFGYVTQSDQQLAYTRPGVAGVTSQKLPLDTGFLAGGSVGRYLNDTWRVEAEFMYQSVDHPTVTIGTNGPSGDGNYASTTVAVNALREFNLLGSTRTRTYAGIGAVYVTEVDVDFERNGVEQSFSGSGSGVQLLLGARYPFGERAFIDAGIRYLIASNQELDGEESTSGRIKADYEPMALTVSFGWRF